MKYSVDLRSYKEKDEQHKKETIKVQGKKKLKAILMKE